MSNDTEVNIDMPSDSSMTDEDSLDNGNIAIGIIFICFEILGYHFYFS